MADYKSSCRDTGELNVLVRYLYNCALKDIKKQNITPLLVETYRSQDRQNYLYCQGRTVSQCTSKGISSAFAKKHCRTGSQVTWTLNSKHKSRKAVDLIPQRKINGKWTAIWNSSDASTKKIINSMIKYGFEAGAKWKTPDSPHFQIDFSGNSVFTKKHTTKEVTLMLQKALNEYLKNEKGFVKLVEDGAWGTNTDKAINLFRKKNGWKPNGKIGINSLKKLIK